MELGDTAQNAIGFNSADNRFTSDLVVANKDGSVLERLEYSLVNNKRLTQKALTTTANGATAIFNYTGAIKFNNIFGIVTTIMQNKTQNMKLSVKPDSLVAYDICANKDIDTFAVGSLISITGTAANAAVSTTAVGALAPSQASGVIATCITAGTIIVTAGAANSGAITWYADWEPLSEGATVTAT
jgi:hypothetical protein